MLKAFHITAGADHPEPSTGGGARGKWPYRGVKRAFKGLLVVKGRIG